MIFREAEPAWLKYALSKRAPIVASVDEQGNPVSWKLPPMRGYGDELTDALLIHGAGTKIMLEKAGPIHGGAADVLKNLAVESVLDPVQLAAKRAVDAAAAAAALEVRNKWILNYLLTKQSFPIADCSVNPCAPFYLTPSEVASFIVWAFPPGTFLRSREGNSGIESGSVWYVEAPGKRRHVMDMDIWKQMGSKPIIDVDSHILLSLPFSVDLRSAVTPPPPPPSGGSSPPPIVVMPPPPPPPPPSGGGGSGGGSGGRNMKGYSFRSFADVLWTVKPGETLTGIAMQVGICTKGPGNTRADWADCLSAAQRIADANSLPDINMIKVGQQLIIPVPVEVKPDGSVVAVPAGGGSFPWGKILALGAAAFFVHKYWR